MWNACITPFRFTHKVLQQIKDTTLDESWENWLLKSEEGITQYSSLSANKVGGHVPSVPFKICALVWRCSSVKLRENSENFQINKIGRENYCRIALTWILHYGGNGLSFANYSYLPDFSLIARILSKTELSSELSSKFSMVKNTDFTMNWH